VWQEGQIPPLGRQAFSICARAPAGRGAIVAFTASQTYADGLVSEFTARAFASAASVRACPSSSAGFPLEAVAGGIVGALAVATAALLGALHVRRRPPQDSGQRIRSTS
jgi:hypothetical protein